MPEVVTRLQMPRKLGFLMDQHPYKVAYGGRNSLKSHSFGRALLTLGVNQSLRILCAREVQKSLADSVHQLLKDLIEELNYGRLYDVTDNAIRGTRNDTLFRFSGLSDQTAQSIKSYEGFHVAWVEEAQGVSKKSWQILLPTIFRTPGAEVWISFNPGMDTDETWERFIINPPPGAKVVEMNWRDALECGWWPEEQEKLRQYDLVYAKDDYDNIWEGKPRTVVAGAIYAREVIDMITEQRYRALPYDPRLPVHRIWDLGWNDLMTVLLVQKPHPSVINVVNYVEDARVTYAEMLQTLDGLRYRWGDDWLPHDATQHHPTSGTNAKKTIERLTGRTAKLIPRSDPEARIKAARMMFPRVYMDNGTRDTPTDRPDRQIGGRHIMERLKRYRRGVPQPRRDGAKLDETAPLHDINSHGADAFGGLAEIVDRIRNDGDTPPIEIEAFHNANAGTGMLG